MGKRQFDPLACQRSARTEVRFWALLAVGCVFTYGGFTVDPQRNCGAGGDCAPWLVPLATVVGLGAIAIGLGTLIANPRRGSRFDEASGELVWWQNRNLLSPGNEGRIAPAGIGRIRIIRDSDYTEVHVYDRAGKRLPYLDSEVIPWPYERWAQCMIERWPHIELVVEG